MTAAARVRSFLARYPLFGVVVLVQLLFLAALGAGTLRPVCQQTIAVETLTPAGEDGAMQAPAVTLPAGGYRVTVSYQARDPADTTPATGASVAALDFSSEQNPAALRCDTVVLTDTYSTVTARLWVGTASQLEDLVLTVTPLQQDSSGFSLENVTLTEQPVWRLVSLCGWLLLFAAVDAALWLVFLGRGHLPRQGWGVPLLLAGGILLASLPFFTDFLYNGHDLKFHCYRIWSAARAMADGQFPVRIASEAFHGYGGAAPQYYCDLFLYLPALLYNAFVPLQTCYQIYVVLINGATMLAAYVSFVQIGGDRKNGAVAAFCYTLCAYRLTNLLLRASVGEYTAMTFLPLVAWGAWAIARKAKPTARDWLPLAFGMAGIVQSHLLTTELAVLFLGVFWLAALPAMLRPARLRAALLAAVTALGLSAWYLLPCVDALQHEYIMISDVHPTPIQSTGAYLIQLLGLFGYAKGSSVPGTAGDMPLTVGLAGCAALLLGVWCCLHRSRWSETRADTASWRGLRAGLALCLLAMYMSSTAFPWDWLTNKLPQKLADLLLKPQFSWRYLTIACVLLGVVTVLGLRLLGTAAPQMARRAAALLVAGTLLYAGTFYRDYAYGQGSFTLRSVETMTDFPVESMGYDYLPAGTDLAIFGSIQATVSDASATARWQADRTLVCENPTQDPVEVALPLLAYRNYSAVDRETGDKLPLQQNEQHCLSVTVPAGYSGTIELIYTSPLLWRLAEAVTLLTWAGLAGAALLRYRRKKTPRRKENEEELACTTI